MIAYKVGYNKKAILKLKKDLMSKNYYNSRSEQRWRNNSANVSRNTNSIITKSFSGKISDSQSSSKFVAKEIVKHINGVKGIHLEKNIRQTLENEYNWKPSKFKRHFFYRKIIINNEDYSIITANKEIEIHINNKIFYVKANGDLTCEVRKKKGAKPLLIENDGKDHEINKIIIQKSNEIEIDGLYKIKNAKFPNFNNDEICLLYNFLDHKNSNDNEAIEIVSNDDDSYDYRNKIDENDYSNKSVRNIRKFNDNKNISKTEKNIINSFNNGSFSVEEDENYNNELNNFDYAVLEIKLNQNKVDELIDQIKKDKEVMEKLITKKILYIGFVDDNKIDCDITDKIKGFNFLLFGFKNSEFCGRNMVQYLDWKSINEIKSLNDKVKSLNDKVKSLNDKVMSLNAQVMSLNNKFETFKNEVDNRFNNLEAKLDKLFAIIPQKEMNKEVPCYLRKKRRRKKGNKKRNEKFININILTEFMGRG